MGGIVNMTLEIVGILIIVINNDLMLLCILCVCIIGISVILFNVLRWNVRPPCAEEENCRTQFGRESEVKHVSAETTVIVHEARSGFVAGLLPQNARIID